MSQLEIANTFTINADVDRTWSVIADEFEDVYKWASGLDDSKANPKATHIPDGATTGGRTCNVPGLGWTDERIVVFDPAARQLGYSVDSEKVPGFVSDMVNLWTLEDAGPGTTRVHQRLTAEVSGPLGAIMKPVLKMQFSRLLSTIKEDLAVYAETGKPSARKAKELANA